MTGARIAAKVTRGINKAGSKTGDGTPLAGTIIRSTQGQPYAQPPVAGTTTEYACTLFLSEYSARDRQGANIAEEDVRAMIAPDAEIAPSNGDKLRVGSFVYSLENVMPYQPGGVVLYFMARARRG